MIHGRLYPLQNGEFIIPIDPTAFKVMGVSVSEYRSWAIPDGYEWIRDTLDGFIVKEREEPDMNHMMFISYYDNWNIHMLERTVEPLKTLTDQVIYVEEFRNSLRNHFRRLVYGEDWWI